MKIYSYFVVGLLFFSSIAMIGLVTGADEGLNISRSFSTPEIIDSDNFFEISVDGANSHILTTGAPMLPVYTETIEVPFGVKNFDIDCNVGQVNTMDLPSNIKKIIPAPQIEVPGYENIKIGPVIDNSIYGSAALYPNDWYSYDIGVGLDKNMNHKTFLTIEMYPVRYKPSLDSVQYVDSINLEINYNNPGSDPFPTASSHDMVIIAPQKFVTDLEPLVTHKNSYDVTTIIKTTQDIYSSYSGVDKPEKIKKFIKDCLEEGGEIEGIKYVLLVGGLNNKIYADPMDTENYGDRWWHVPVRWSNLDYHEPGPLCDLYYSDIYRSGGVFDDWNKDEDELIGEWKKFGGDRPDLYPDVALGRLACRNNNEVRSVVDKIINYENNAYNSDWFEEIVLVSGDGFLDQDDINFEWDTSGVETGTYTIYAQSNNDEGEYGPVEEITITVDKSQPTSLTFNHDDHTRVPDFPKYPSLPIAEISSVSTGDVVGIDPYFYEPEDNEAYCNEFTGWGNVEYENNILHIRGKTYDPKPYGNLTDIHIWIENSVGEKVFDEWKYGFETFSEGDWTTGEKIQLGRAGAMYYMPSNFDPTYLWSSNNNWYGEEDVMNRISEGAGFVFFSGHGSPAVWANHYPGIPGNRQNGDVEGLRVVKIDKSGVIDKLIFPMDELSNEYELPVIIVGGCHNSMFTVSLIASFLDAYIDNNMFTYGLPTPECWGWYPVQQSKTGAIATIGNTGYGLGSLGRFCTVGGVDNWITTEFFVKYAEGYDILGEAHAQALTSYKENIRISDEGDAKTVMEWVLLGDPSLKLGGYPPQQGIAIDARGGFKPGDTIKLEAKPSGQYYEWSLDKDGDGEFDRFITGQTIEEEWDNHGVFYVKAEANNGESCITVVDIKNQEPNTPTIEGPTSLEAGQTYTYDILATDPNGDELYYFIEWGDDKYTIITPEDETTVSHQWNKRGASTITVKAIDSNSAQWSEETLTVTIEKSKAKIPDMPILRFLRNLLEKLPNLFPMLRQIIEIG